VPRHEFIAVQCFAAGAAKSAPPILPVGIDPWADQSSVNHRKPRQALASVLAQALLERRCAQRFGANQKGSGMENALLVGLSQQTALQRQLDIVAHNLANMSTNAYKAERPLFHTYLAPIRDAEGRHDDARMVNDYGMVRDMTEGALKATNNPFDVAISGDGYFIVGTANGERYTRNGHFSLDSTGRLVTSDGDPVLDSNHSEISFASDETGFTIARDGSISTSAGTKGKLGIVEFANQGDLTRTGGSLYETTETPTDVASPNVQQGMIEESNVVPIVEMTTMIDILRSYNQSAQLMKSAEDLSEKAVSDLGKT
jgi:flagellar basal-body rod protein FlgF